MARQVGNKNGVYGEVLACLRAARRPLQIAEIAARTGRERHGVQNNVSALCREGRVRSVGRVLAGCKYARVYALTAREP